MTVPERQRVRVEGRELTVSRLDRLLWPDDGLTKADLIAYFVAVAPIMLPHLRDRPLTVVRFPDGITGPGFYQKNRPAYAPDWIATHRVVEDARTGDATEYVLAHDVPTLVWLANQNAIELHPWLAPRQRPDRPAACVIDIDPMPPTGFTEARWVALAVKALLDALGMASYPKLSGATGIHVYIPTDGKTTFEQSRAFAEWVAAQMAAQFPREVTNIRAVDKRGPRVYIDPLQNLPGKTIVAPYSPRPRPGAPVSAPVTWDELAHVTPDMFTVRTMPARVKTVGDLFAPALTIRQSLPDPRRLPAPHSRAFAGASLRLPER